jgi:hypothetical protein
MKGQAMSEDGNALAARRFLRTLRVTTATALAEYDLSRGRSATAPVAVFRALAAKGAGAWRYPDAGVTSADGLLVATLVRDQDGAPQALQLQAQGSAGLSSFAEREAELRFGSHPAISGAFDRDGRWRVSLHGVDIKEAELASFDLRFKDGLP